MYTFILLLLSLKWYLLCINWKNYWKSLIFAINNLLGSSQLLCSRNLSKNLIILTLYDVMNMLQRLHIKRVNFFAQNQF